MFIYAITNTSDSRVYIGQTRNVEGRWRDHLRAAGNPSNSPLTNSMRKYGQKLFSIEEICQANSQEELDFLEMLFIVARKSTDPFFGYNIRDGGRNYGTVSQETKIILSFLNLGKTASPEVRAKISEKLRGIPSKRRGRKFPRKPPFIRKTPAEISEILSKSMKGKPKSLEHRLALSKAKKGTKLKAPRGPNKKTWTRPDRKEKTLEEFFGAEKALEIREKLRKPRRRTSYGS